jgi:hypothetical protein
MNLALSAVVIFILLMPPIVFYLSFSYGRYPKANLKFSFLDGVLASAIISLFVHASGVFVLDKEVRFDILLKIFSGDLKDLEHKISNADLMHCIQHFALYNFTLLFIFILLGRLARYLVVHLKHNNAQSELLRLNNRWWYFFNGYESGGRFLDMVFVDAVVETKECTVIYSGWLLDFVCEGERLDRIYLEDVLKRKLEVNNAGNQDAEAKLSSAISVPGDKFSISYDNIVNLNVSFVKLEVKKTDE